MLLNEGFAHQVGVVDEVQMVGDPVRGSSFTRAILGLPARTLHVCGDPAVLPLLHLMAQDAGAPLSAAESGLQELQHSMLLSKAGFYQA